MARAAGLTLALLSGLAVSGAAEPPTCPADGTGECQGYQGPSALQGKVQAQQKANAEEEAGQAARLVAGVRVNVRGASKEAGSLAGRHTWVISLPDDCSDADVRSFAHKMPPGATAVFEGLQSAGGLCFFAMEGTEAELEEELETHPGAVLVEADLEFEARRAGLPGAGRAAGARNISLLAGHMELPENEGQPQISPGLMPQRVSMLEADGRTAGPYAAVRHVNVPTSEYDNLCGGPFLVNVYYPVLPDEPDAPLPKMPLISYGHGMGCGGDKIDLYFYRKSLKALVEQGFVIVAPQNGPADYCGINVDMLQAITWLKGTEFAPRIDFERVAVLGYSMGAREALVVSSVDTIVSDYGIKACVALMPHCVYGCPQPLVPTYYYTGTRDTTCPPGPVEAAFNALEGVPKVFKNTEGALHWEVGHWGGNRFMPEAISMLRCHLHGDKAACDSVYAAECAGGATTDCAMLNEGWPAAPATPAPTPAPTPKPTPAPPTPAPGPANYNAVMGCPRKARGAMTAGLHVDQRLAKRCCNAKGKCSSYPCERTVTWEQADASCRGNGLRLCTQQELERNKCCNKGCGHDKRYVWSSTPA